MSDLFATFTGSFFVVPYFLSSCSWVFFLVCLSLFHIVFSYVALRSLRSSAILFRAFTPSRTETQTWYTLWHSRLAGLPIPK